MADTFTPAQIAQILQAFFETVGTRQYVGARYVPLFGRKDEESIEWDNSKPYEQLTVVLYQGNSFTSRQYVPAGVDINNELFWAETGNFNAQLEAYRREVADYVERITANENAISAINTALPIDEFESKTVLETIEDDIETLQANVSNQIEILSDNTSQAIANQNDAIAAQNDVIDDYVLSNAPFNYGYLGFARNETGGTRTSLVWTDDFNVVHTVVPEINNLSDNSHYLSDSCYLSRIGDWWYASFGGSYYKSQDLLNWTLGESSFENPYNLKRQAGVIHQLKDESYIYMTSLEYDDTPTTGALYNQSTYSYIAYRPITQNEENGELVFGNITTLNVCDKTDGTETYIDPTLCYNPINQLYYFAAKNEITKKIEVYSGETLASLTLMLTSRIVDVIEAPCLVWTGSSVILKYETFALNTAAFHSAFGTGHFNKQVQMYAVIASMNSSANVFLSNMMYSLVYYRHLTLSNVDPKTYALLEKISNGVHKSSFSNSGYYKYITFALYPKADGTPTVLNNWGEFVEYQFTSDSPASVTIDIALVFNDKHPIYIHNNRNSNHTVTLGTTFKQAGTTFTLTPGSTLMILFMGASNNVAYLLENS